MWTRRVRRAARKGAKAGKACELAALRAAGFEAFGVEPVDALREQAARGGRSARTPKRDRGASRSSSLLNIRIGSFLGLRDGMMITGRPFGAPRGQPLRMADTDLAKQGNRNAHCGA